MDGLSTVPTDQARASAGGMKRGSMSRLIKAEHKHTVKMLGYTLTLGDAESYGHLSAVARQRLTLAERAGLAVAFLGSLPGDCALQAASAALGGAGDPLPPFLGGMDEARHWTRYATEEELKAYGLACYEAMAPRDQAVFFRHISAVEVA